jgi:hypothetical protein
MDLTAIIASVVSMVLGVGIVAKFMGKILPQAVKYVGIIKDAINLLDDAVEMLKDGKVTEDEIKKFQADVETLKLDFKK